MNGPDLSPDRHPSSGPVADLPDQTEDPAQQSPLVREEQLQRPQPPFQPLFTLVTDAATRATHHPQVHYIFSDDDPDILTAALARHGHQPSPDASANQAPPPHAPPNERAIVLDLVPKTTDNHQSTTLSAPGYDVAWVSSLSSSWAVVNAKTSAMTEESSNNANTLDSESSARQRLILRIEGVGDNAVSSTNAALQTPSTRTRKRSMDERDLRMSASSPSGAAQDKAKEDYAAIVDEFDKRMSVLRKVVDAGLERQRSAQGARLADDELSAGIAAHGANPLLPPDHRPEQSAQ
ncbi:hypothetical protein diail_10126 [Diaporthe ilicicola]|nr:hypothetical protein diail_10126 [Diaporthe ilicicola]